MEAVIAARVKQALDSYKASQQPAVAPLPTQTLSKPEALKNSFNKVTANFNKADPVKFPPPQTDYRRVAEDLGLPASVSAAGGPI